MDRNDLNRITTIVIVTSCIFNLLIAHYCFKSMDFYGGDVVADL